MWFTKTFYQHIMFRHSCGNCHFSNTTRPSDITIADFWGWQKTNPEFNKDDKGVSLVLVNTEKGRQLWESIKQDLDHFPVELQDCLQPNLQHTSVPHPKRMQFEEDYATKGFRYVYNHNYDDSNIIVSILKKIKRKLRKISKRF